MNLYVVWSKICFGVNASYAESHDRSENVFGIYRDLSDARALREHMNVCYSKCESHDGYHANNLKSDELSSDRYDECGSTSESDMDDECDSTSESDMDEKFFHKSVLKFSTSMPKFDVGNDILFDTSNDCKEKFIKTIGGFDCRNCDYESVIQDHVRIKIIKFERAFDVGAIYVFTETGTYDGTCHIQILSDFESVIKLSYIRFRHAHDHSRVRCDLNIDQCWIDTLTRLKCEGRTYFAGEQEMCGITVSKITLL
jgi:hypothetical protein